MGILITAEKIDKAELVLLVNPDGTHEWSSHRDAGQVAEHLRKLADSIEQAHAPDVIVSREEDDVVLICPHEDCRSIDSIATAGTLLEWCNLIDVEVDDDGNLSAKAELDESSDDSSSGDGFVCTGCGRVVSIDVEIVEYVG